MTKQTHFLSISLTLLVLLCGTSLTHAETLEHWLNESVNQHPSVLSARAQVDVANFKLLAADQPVYNPELELDTESIEDVNTTMIGLSQTIDWGDARGANTSVAKSGQSLAKYTYELTRHQVAQDMLMTLANEHTSNALKNLAEQRHGLMQRFKTLANQRFNYGDLSSIDVDLAKLSYAQARFNLAAAGSGVVRAQQRLISLTGRNNPRLPPMPSKFPDPVKLTNDADDVVQQLPEMLKATAAVKLAQSNIKAQVSQGAANPTIALRAGREETDHVLGLTLSIPLQIRNNFKAEVDAANAEMIQAEREAIGVYRTLQSRLEIATVSYGLNRDAWIFWQHAGAETLVEQMTLLERLWRAGELSTSDYLLQLTQALETKANAIEQRGRLWRDWAQWLVATGQIDQWLLKKAEGAK